MIEIRITNKDNQANFRATATIEGASEDEVLRALHALASVHYDLLTKLVQPTRMVSAKRDMTPREGRR